MQFRSNIYRGESDYDMMHVEQMRSVIKRSRELLANNPVPDTFVGRQTHEPFPQEDSKSQIGPRADSEELHLRTKSGSDRSFGAISFPT